MAEQYDLGRRSIGRWAACVASCVVACALVVSAQPTYLKEAPGTWKPWKMTMSASTRAASGASAAELKAFEANLVAFREILRRVPAVATPRGFSVEVWGHLGGYDRPATGQPPSSRLPIAGGIDFGAFPIYETTRNGATVRIDTGETPLLLFTVNDLRPAAIGQPGPPDWHVLESDVVLQPPATGERAGFPRYDDIVVITKRTAPLWVPVALQEAWTLQLQVSKQALTSAQQVVDKLQHLLVARDNPANEALHFRRHTLGVLLTDDGGEAGHVPQRRPQVVGDGVDERLEILVGLLEFEGALRDALLEDGVQTRNLLLGLLPLGDVHRGRKAKRLPALAANQAAHEVNVAALVGILQDQVDGLRAVLVQHAVEMAVEQRPGFGLEKAVGEMTDQVVAVDLEKLDRRQVGALDRAAAAEREVGDRGEVEQGEIPGAQPLDFLPAPHQLGIQDQGGRDCPGCFRALAGLRGQGVLAATP